MTEDIEARPYRYYSAAQLDTLFVRVSRSRGDANRRGDTERALLLNTKLDKIDEERERRMPA